MLLPKIYAHITPDGRLLDAREVPPVSWETIGGKIYEYVPLGWMMSDQSGFTLPEEGRPVVVKILTMSNGEKLSEQARYSACPRLGVQWMKQFWGLWGWKYLEE